jgi:hypothetical protein
VLSLSSSVMSERLGHVVGQTQLILDILALVGAWQTAGGILDAPCTHYSHV